MSYKLSEQDVWRYFLYQFGPMLLIVYFFTPFVLMFSFRGLNLIFQLVISGLLACFLFWITKQSTVKLNNQRGITTYTTLEISDTGVRIRNESNIEFTRWNEIKRIETNRKYIYFMTIQKGIYILPKRAFSSVNESKDFLDSAKKTFQANKKST